LLQLEYYVVNKIFTNCRSALRSTASGQPGPRGHLVVRTAFSSGVATVTTPCQRTTAGTASASTSIGRIAPVDLVNVRAVSAF